MIVELESRYGDVTKLIPLNNNIYKVCFATEYGNRIIRNEDGSIYAFDPPGGPFVSVGSNIVGLKVTSIYQDESTKDLLVTLE